jgi:uncharacterized small protein (DUF1192 family)
LATNSSQNENLAAVVTEVSERVTVLVKDEIELARAEMVQKARSLAAGIAAIAVGAVCGVFVLVFALATLAWGLNSILSSIWLGFAITLIVLMVVTGGAVTFALRKLKVGAPTPNMAIDEAKKIRATVSTKTQGAP